MLCASVNMKMANDFLLMFQFDKIDKDGNGTIDIDEFVGALLPGVAKQVRHTACI
jgi:Ca2+-binding EF-hand superfamily protein